MSFLPYDRSGAGDLALPLTASLILHGALVALLTTASFAIIPPKEDYSSDLLISLEILDLAGLDNSVPIAPEALNTPENLDAPEIDPLFEDPDLTQNTPAFAEPEPIEQDTAPVEPEAPEEPEVIAEPEPIPVEPEVEEEPAPPEPEVPVVETEPVLPDPEPQAPPPTPAPILSADIFTPSLQLEALSPIESTFISPLAQRASLPDAPVSGDLSLEIPNLSAPRLALSQPNIETPPNLELAALTPPDPLVDQPATQPKTGVGTRVQNPSASAQLVGTLLRRIRAAQAPTCTIALPRRAADGRVGLSVIGASRAALDDFSARIVDGLPSPVSAQRDMIDDRQCAALDAISLTNGYPAARIGFQFQSSSLKSGDTLNARIIGAGGLNITVLLIDDNGVVQDLSRFVTFSEDTALLSTPVARSGSGRDTRQILMVLGTETPSINLGDMDGLLAQDVFDGLDRDVLTASAFALAVFDVR